MALTFAPAVPPAVLAELALCVTSGALAVEERALRWALAKLSDPTGTAALPPGELTAAEDSEDAPAAALSSPAVAMSNAGVAIVPLQGFITPHPIPVLEACGMTTSGDTMAALLAEALASEAGAVLVDVNSPGGSVAGTVEGAARLEALRSKAEKPIVAVSRYMNASAAYWLSCAMCHEIVASPSSLTGSIGVIAMHLDASGAYEQAGLRFTMITAGKYKGEGSDTMPLPDEARAHVQSQLDLYYDLFVEAVARSRRTRPDAVKNGYGQGRVLAARPAMAAGLVDRVEPVEAVLQRIGSDMGRRETMNRRALAEDRYQEAVAEWEAAARIDDILAGIAAQEE